VVVGGHQSRAQGDCPEVEGKAADVSRRFLLGTAPAADPHTSGGFEHRRRAVTRPPLAGRQPLGVRAMGSLLANTTIYTGPVIASAPILSRHSVWTVHSHDSGGRLETGLDAEDARFLGMDTHPVPGEASRRWVARCRAIVGHNREARQARSTSSRRRAKSLPLPSAPGAVWSSAIRARWRPPGRPACGTPMETRWFCPTCSLPVGDEEDEEFRFP
jgi:hypothetical protein